jgi:transposase
MDGQALLSRSSRARGGNNEGGMSRTQAAKQLGVAIGTAIGWMKRVGETGSVGPGQMGS